MRGKGKVLMDENSRDDFVYEIVVDSISPLTASLKGGTVLTIVGDNFSEIRN